VRERERERVCEREMMLSSKACMLHEEERGKGEERRHGTSHGLGRGETITSSHI